MLAEIASRVVTHHRFARYETGIHVQGDSRWADDPTVFWTNRPYYLEYDVSAQYDELGLRVRPGEVHLPGKVAGELRVLLLGGSAIAGMGSNQDGDWLKITGVPTHPIPDAIDGLLEAELRRALPGRPVRVFNAAVASHALPQSMGRYRSLRDRLDPDWVISMDGANDPHSLGPGETVFEFLRQSWERHPIHRFPIRQARLAMRNSAAVFLAGEMLFFRSGLIRTPRNSRQDPDVLSRWLQSSAQAPTEPLPGEDVQRAVDEFVETLTAFDDLLTTDGRAHLLLVQPHLSWRNVEQLAGEERALWNYYFTVSRQRDMFLRELQRRAQALHRKRPAVVGMDGVHDWPGWVFVDYCHFSRDANRRIAAELARAILGDPLGTLFENRTGPSASGGPS